MRAVEVYRNGVLAGTLTEEDSRQFVFRYDDQYYRDAAMKPVSLTLLKTQQVYRSSFLFPFFANMLSEGVNRTLQSRRWRIDEEDDFGILMVTAQYDTAGAVTVKPMATV